MSQTDNLVDRLARIPERISQAIAGWSKVELRTPSAGAEWSAAAIFAHLRASDDIITPRVYLYPANRHPIWLSMKRNIALNLNS